MWPSAGLALILLVGLNAGVPQSYGSLNEGATARPALSEAHPAAGRGERTVLRATNRRVAAASVRRLGGTGQPAVPQAGPLAVVVLTGAAAIDGSVAGPRNAIWETPYAPRAPPGVEETSLHAG